MSDSPWGVRPINFLTELNQDVSLPDWDEDDESDHNTRNARKNGDGATENDFVDDRRANAPVENAYAYALTVHPGGSGQRAANILKILSDIELTENSIFGDVSEFRSCLRRRLGLK